MGTPGLKATERSSRCLLPVVLLGLALLVASRPAANADEWPGWRGGACDGRSVSPRGPVHWSPTRSVVWKTSIPGEGHSSPIVTSDAVYVTTARRVGANARLLVAIQIGLWLALLLVAAPAIVFLVRRCAAEEQEGVRLWSLINLAGFGLAVALLCGLVFYGEESLNFSRAVERGWIAACLCGMFCLTVSALSRPPGARATLLGGLSWLAFAAVLAFTIPDRPHTVEAAPFSDVSVLIYLVIALPAITGAAVLIRCLPNARKAEGTLPEDTASSRRLSTALAARGLVALLAVTWLFVLVRLVAMQRRATETTVSVGTPYEPMLPWWAVLIPAGALVLCLLARRKTGAVWWANLGLVASAVLLGVIGLLALAEQLIARVPYLSYLLGTPRFAPLLGPQAVALFAASCALALLGELRSAARGRGSPSIALPEILRAAGYALTLLYFGYANYLPKGPRLERAIVSVNRETGVIRWISGGLIAPGGIMHSDNSPATPTPVTDGERLYAYFGTPGLLGVDVRGRRLWINAQLPFASREGVASSPILCQGKVVVLSESDAGGYLAAVDGKTGKLIWRTVRQKKRHSFAGNCRTPCVQWIDGREVIVVWGYEDLSGYDPVTGRELWSRAIEDLGTGGNPVASAVSDGRHLFLVGPYKTICLDNEKLAGSGTAIQWQQDTDDGAQCSSPVVKNGLLFAVSDNGYAYCLDARTGQPLWSKDLQEQHYASVTAIGNRIYFCSAHGRTTIIACDRTCRVLSHNDLGEQVHASLAPVDGDLFIRTKRHLYCLRER
jgi:outer membrane protein assembly factor BamB